MNKFYAYKKWIDTPENIVRSFKTIGSLARMTNNIAKMKNYLKRQKTPTLLWVKGEYDNALIEDSGQCLKFLEDICYDLGLIKKAVGRRVG